jgi:mono/diheme cytochrome c family protein
VAVLDDRRMTLDALDRGYQRRFGRGLTPAESLVTRVWLRDLRDRFRDNIPKFDEPFSGPDLRNAALMPNGPSRTQPFRNLVRNILDRPATLGDFGFCKIPSVYEQRNRRWGQFDGTVGNPVTRSVLAALAIGATKENLIVPDIQRNVVDAIEYTRTLLGPRYDAVFPDEAARLEPARVERGRRVYDQHCRSCHGARDARTGAWQPGARTGEVVPVEQIGTDPERVRFRYYEILADVLYDHFPSGHPLKPRREELRPGPAGKVAGFINTPLESVWARAPYLHNGSVLTLAELINLKPRRKRFFRGRNFYDPQDVGLVDPGTATARAYYAFDTGERGNSNRGHDYPWAYRGPGWDAAALADLLEFLKTQD